VERRISSGDASVGEGDVLVAGGALQVPALHPSMAVRQVHLSLSPYDGDGELDDRRGTEDDKAGESDGVAGGRASSTGKWRRER